MFNIRSTDSRFHRLTFVLLGVALPSDLIKDPNRTPFNIGTRIDLYEFSRADSHVLEKGLAVLYGTRARPIFDRIYYWTSGHPYLTQTLCQKVVGQYGRWTNRHIDMLVEKTFLSPEARNEHNTKFVRNMIENSPQKRPLLLLYKQILAGKQVQEDVRSPVQNYLKLSGLVYEKKGVLVASNEIYRQAFNETWISNTMPVDWTRRIAVTAIVALIVVSAAFVYNLWISALSPNTLVTQFESTDIPIQRLGHLNDLTIWEEKQQADHPIVRFVKQILPWRGEAPADIARNLFYDTLSPEERLAIFNSVNTNSDNTLNESGTPSPTSESSRQQVENVVQNLYTQVVRAGADQEQNALLEAMAAALETVEGNPPCWRKLSSGLRVGNSPLTTYTSTR